MGSQTYYAPAGRGFLRNRPVVEVDCTKKEEKIKPAHKFAHFECMGAPKGGPSHPSQTHNDLTVLYSVIFGMRHTVSLRTTTHWNAWRKFDPPWATTPVRFMYIYIYIYIYTHT